MLGEPCRAEAQCRCSVAIMIISLFDAPPTFAQARTLADRLSRPVACSAATLAAPLRVDRYAPPVQSSILEAKAEPISDKRLPSDNKSLFDAVPLLYPFVVAPLGISRAAAKQTGKQHGKGTVNLGNGFASVAYESGGNRWFAIHEL
jgi:hypothetical protein